MQIVRRFMQLAGTPRGNVVVRLPWGVDIEVNPRETIGRSIWTTGITDLSVCESICRVLRPGDVAFDIGANIGYMTGLMAACVGKAGHVECFEPNPNVIPLLKRNLKCIQQAGMLAPSIRECAVADQIGMMHLVCPMDSDGNDGIASLTDDADVGIKVDVITLDSLCSALNNTLRLIKVDVEGHEASVFRGAERLLENRKIEFVVFEEHRGVDAESFSVLQSSGYEVFRLGWNSESIVCVPLHSEPVHSPFEPANFIATYDTDTLFDAFQGKGFTLFSAQKWMQHG